VDVSLEHAAHTVMPRSRAKPCPIHGTIAMAAKRCKVAKLHQGDQPEHVVLVLDLGVEHVVKNSVRR
jgi:hypothetical protein